MAAAQPASIDLPVGATLVPGGAAFRVWAPRAKAVCVSGDCNGWKQNAPAKLHSIGGGHWIGFIPGVKDSDPYLFYIEGRGSSGYKRGPRARLHRFRERSGNWRGSRIQNRRSAAAQSFDGISAGFSANAQPP